MFRPRRKRVDEGRVATGRRPRRPGACARRGGATPAGGPGGSARPAGRGRGRARAGRGCRRRGGSSPAPDRTAAGSRRGSKARTSASSSAPRSAGRGSARSPPTSSTTAGRTPSGSVLASRERGDQAVPVATSPPPDADPAQVGHHGVRVGHPVVVARVAGSVVRPPDGGTALVGLLDEAGRSMVLARRREARAGAGPAARAREQRRRERPVGPGGPVEQGGDGAGRSPSRTLARREAEPRRRRPSRSSRQPAVPQRGPRRGGRPPARRAVRWPPRPHRSGRPPRRPARPGGRARPARRGRRRRGGAGRG